MTSPRFTAKKNNTRRSCTRLLSALACFGAFLFVQFVSISAIAQDDLDWESLKRKLPKPARGTTTAKQMLELFGVTDSHLRFLVDNEPLEDADMDTLTRIMYRFPDLPLEDIHRWTSRQWDESQLFENTDDARINFYRITGIATKVHRYNLLPELAELLRFDHFFIVRVESDHLSNPVLVATQFIPLCWQPQIMESEDGSHQPGFEAVSSISEPCSIDALFLKTLENEPRVEGLSLLFAANRIAWHPKQVSPRQLTNPGIIYQSELGIDVGLWDDVRRYNRQPIGTVDRELFYQLLAMSQKTDNQHLKQLGTSPLDVSESIRKASTLQGGLMHLSGTVRKVTKVEVPDYDVKQRFGLDHYYQIDMFMPLGDRSIQLKRSRDDDQPLVFEHSFPIQVCTADVPENLKELINQPLVGVAEIPRIRVRGFFFKIWSYRSSYASSQDIDRMQLGPLLIVAEPEILPSLESQTGMLGLVGVGGVLLLLGGLWWSLWKNMQEDRTVTRARAARRKDKQLGATDEPVDPEAIRAHLAELEEL